MNQLLTIRQVANIIGFDERTVRSWCNRGDVFPTARKIPNISTGQWRVLSDDVALLAMLDGHSENAALLADTNQRVARLETEAQQQAEKIAWYESEYSKLVNTYNTLLNEAKELDSIIAEQKVIMDDLKRYKDHYNEQQQRRRRRSA